jgi:hypothetical protein
MDTLTEVRKLPAPPLAAFGNCLFTGPTRVARPALAHMRDACARRPQGRCTTGTKRTALVRGSFGFISDESTVLLAGLGQNSAGKAGDNKTSPHVFHVRFGGCR